MNVLSTEQRKAAAPPAIVEFAVISRLAGEFPLSEHLDELVSAHHTLTPRCSAAQELAEKIDPRCGRRHSGRQRMIIFVIPPRHSVHTGKRQNFMRKFSTSSEWKGLQSRRRRQAMFSSTKGQLLQALPHSATDSLTMAIGSLHNSSPCKALGRRQFWWPGQKIIVMSSAMIPGVS